MTESVTPTKSCIVVGCSAETEIVDNRGHTFRMDPDMFVLHDGTYQRIAALVEKGDRDIYYCLPHAREFLFPLIDQAAGNTMRGIIADLKVQDCW